MVRKSRQASRFETRPPGICSIRELRRSVNLAFAGAICGKGLLQANRGTYRGV
jgi:hypothetical protein